MPVDDANSCNLVCWRSMGLSDIVWVDGRYGSQAKMKTKHAMQI